MESTCFAIATTSTIYYGVNLSYGLFTIPAMGIGLRTLGACLNNAAEEGGVLARVARTAGNAIIRGHIAGVIGANVGVITKLILEWNGVGVEQSFPIAFFVSGAGAALAIILCHSQLEALTQENAPSEDSDPIDLTEVRRRHDQPYSINLTRVRRIEVQP